MNTPQDRVRSALRAYRSWVVSDKPEDQNQAQAALGRARALCKRHGLDPRGFDFPGDHVADAAAYQAAPGRGYADRFHFRRPTGTGFSLNEARAFNDLMKAFEQTAQTTDGLAEALKPWGLDD